MQVEAPHGKLINVVGVVWVGLRNGSQHLAGPLWLPQTLRKTFLTKAGGRGY